MGVLSGSGMTIQGPSGSGPWYLRDWLPLQLAPSVPVSRTLPQPSRGQVFSMRLGIRSTGGGGPPLQGSEHLPLTARGSGPRLFGPFDPGYRSENHGTTLRSYR